jgi:hypothetical protein
VKLLLKKQNVCLNNRLIWCLPLVFLLGGAALVSYGIVSFSYPCLFHRITGIPCFTCGTTRALLSLIRLDIISALKTNPFITMFFLAWILFFIYSGVAAILNLPKVSLGLSKKEIKIVLAVFISLFLINWLYLIYMKI